MVNASIADRYYVETEPISNGPGIMSSLRVNVFLESSAGTAKVGEYIRNHAGLYDTFFPFQQNGKWYALYSRNYTATRVMELPSCRDIAGEEPDTHGFCPVDFHVPFLEKRVLAAGHAGLFGFVAGCIWGDDTSWKIQYLDLSKISEGVVVRDDRFGYISIPEKDLRLADCLRFHNYDPPDYPIVDITTRAHFDLRDGSREAFVG
ncbi:MAG: hypothetical protein ACREVL_13910 [Solimonas sp.]